MDPKGYYIAAKETGTITEWFSKDLSNPKEKENQVGRTELKQVWRMCFLNEKDPFSYKS